MPLYEFCCRRCGERVEGIFPFGGGPKRHAGDCGGAMDRLISRSAVHFIENENGGGSWSENGYRNHVADHLQTKDGKFYTFPSKVRRKVGKIIG